ncbi:MAG: glutamate--tRNA ligase [Nanoarchaeota archaeon]|nr:glutamate--tRNA ligase [Nanoarchaeota archaeon]
MDRAINLDMLIRKYALQNAVRYEGKATPGAVIGKVLGEQPELKNKSKEVQQRVKEIIEEINKLGAELQRAELEKLAPELLERKSERREGLKPLPDAKEGKVVMRMAPSPSGPLHIGHAYVTSLNYEYVKMYCGKMYFRIEDTNPSNIYTPAYDLIPEDARWLTDNCIAEFIIQSERMDVYYKYAERLFEKGAAYVCTCDNEEVKEMIKKEEACPCRELKPAEQLKRWKNMFTGYAEGEAVVRFKSDLHHKNPAMRDFPLFRINEDEHPRVGKKYRVWPLMNLSVAIDDLEYGTTHALRGKDHADNAKRQEMIHKVLNHKTPIAISVGRINFEGLEVSCSKTREKIEAGDFEGWDDIRLPFLLALKRRGYQPGALRKYAMSVGVTQTDKSVSAEDFFKTINAFNKELLEPRSYKYFFVKDPVKMTIDNAPEIQVEFDLHPESKKGGRVFVTNDEFFISKDDLDSIKDGQIVRLMDCLNFKKDKKKFVYISKEYEDYKNAGANKGHIIHWVLDDDIVNVEVRMPDGSFVKGIGEKWMNDIKEGQIVQLERFGFVRCDSVEEDKTVFWFAHK